jgi:hypothetical protein
MKGIGIDILIVLLITTFTFNDTQYINIYLSRHCYKQNMENVTELKVK